MHSRIFAMSSTKGEAQLYDVPEYFVPTYADYTDEMSDLHDIEWLADNLKFHKIDFTLEDNCITFHDKGKYFENKFNEFKEALEQLNQLTLDEFSKRDTSLYSIKSATYDESGFWFMCNNEYPEAMQSFMRYVELETPYFIEKIFDYHF